MWRDYLLAAKEEKMLTQMTLNSRLNFNNKIWWCGLGTATPSIETLKCRGELSLLFLFHDFSLKPAWASQSADGRPKQLWGKNRGRETTNSARQYTSMSLYMVWIKEIYFKNVSGFMNNVFRRDAWSTNHLLLMTNMIGSFHFVLSFWKKQRNGWVNTEHT